MESFIHGTYSTAKNEEPSYDPALSFAFIGVSLLRRSTGSRASSKILQAAREKRQAPSSRRRLG